MKICSLGDIHGKSIWKKILFGSIQNYNHWRTELNNGIVDYMDSDYPYRKYDKIIFIGDYVDSFTESNVQILNNLEDIIHFKKQYSDKVILLIGNHDSQYIKAAAGTMSGYRETMHVDLRELFTNNINLFQIAYQIDNKLWTHAGVTNKWKLNCVDGLKDEDYRFYDMTKDMDNIADLLNFMFESNNKDLYIVGKRSGGYSDMPSPLWCRPSEWEYDPLPGYQQIVGHTPSSQIKTIEINDLTSYTVIDVLDHLETIYEIILD